MKTHNKRVKNGFLRLRYEIRQGDHFFDRLAKKLMIAKPLIVSTTKNETAFSTGVELNRIREYKSIGKVGSEPIRKIVVTPPTESQISEYQKVFICQLK